jgi:transposase-like protein
MTMVRGEVITALERRRRWRREEKEQLVAASLVWVSVQQGPTVPSLISC